MAKGSRYWATSYIVLKSGKKIYLKNSVGYIERGLKSPKETINLTISRLLSEETISLKKEDIYYYGEL